MSFAARPMFFPETGGAGSHRYWRVRGFSGLFSFLEVTEVQFHTSGGRVIGTLASSDVPAFGSLANLNDNDTSNASRAYWSSATAEAAGFYISIDAGSAVAVTSIRFGANTNSLRYPLDGCEVQWSDDNSSWTSAGVTGPLSYPGNDTLSGPITFS